MTTEMEKAARDIYSRAVAKKRDNAEAYLYRCMRRQFPATSAVVRRDVILKIIGETK